MLGLSVSLLAQQNNDDLSWWTVSCLVIDRFSKEAWKDDYENSKEAAGTYPPYTFDVPATSAVFLSDSDCSQYLSRAAVAGHFDLYDDTLPIGTRVIAYPSFAEFHRNDINIISILPKVELIGL